MGTDPNRIWVTACSASELKERGKMIVKHAGKQILLWQTEDRIFACNNRCPHEGYPLAEGTMSQGCVLTCNWHNWKFDLASGETLLGNDTLRLYAVKFEDGVIMIDVTDPPAEEIRQKALAGLVGALDANDYEWIARELARYQMAGGDLMETLTHAFVWAQDRFERGATHAQGAAADWLTILDGLSGHSPADRLIPVLEIAGYLAFDAKQDGGCYPFAPGAASAFRPQDLEDAIEREDVDTAIRQLRAGLADMGGDGVRASLERAALRHYQGFGHSTIFVQKSYELLSRLGPAANEAILLPLVRELCMARREDLIPEFRVYHRVLAEWGAVNAGLPTPEAFRGQGVDACLRLISGGGTAHHDLYGTVLYAAADAMLHFDAAYRHYIDKPKLEAIDWLDFTHAITFLNAARHICTRQPSLWPQALLQAGCFLGRNVHYTDWGQDVSAWAVSDPEALFTGILEGLLDHGEPIYIFPAHVVKLTMAVREEVAFDPSAPFVPVLLAALNRFVHEPMKRKHMRRVAKQAVEFAKLA